MNLCADFIFQVHNVFFDWTDYTYVLPQSGEQLIIIIYSAQADGTFCLVFNFSAIIKSRCKSSCEHLNFAHLTNLIKSSTPTSSRPLNSPMVLMKTFARTDVASGMDVACKRVSALKTTYSHAFQSMLGYCWYVLTVIFTLFRSIIFYLGKRRFC